MLLSATIPALLVAPLALASQQYPVYQRLLPQSSSPSTASLSSFESIGSISIPDEASGLVGKLSLSVGEQSAGNEVEDDGTGWYQVGVQLEEGDDEGEWLIASTRSCYLSAPPVVKVQVNGTRPLSISVHSSDPKSNTCGTKSVVKTPKDLSSVIFETSRTAKTVLPLLGAPPVVDTTGTPVVPPPEKGFLQKYWMYIVGLALFFAVQMGPDEPREGGGGGGGK
ncbi:hypothetical protein L198_02029 [Cryptococcus wingfieldii CBS 7118]|uniref:ER membrane protein complex subunit 10 n=1 Tax=Cryptococcus wingfieldii CBS 7118 TaxID=1295528 RepID=A0A1E3JX52_9TREE|nr:hypothetical protein L198_02029 [Cryptococcus wingfieldii CBS 7118]ODO05336.1 hypothetical protein L198_02029 [Cryptococcus wingfieldii CBS 7118]